MKKFRHLFTFLVIPGMLFLTTHCSLNSRGKNFKTNELNLTQLRETAIHSAKWSLDNNLDHMNYQAMCAAYGILKVAAVTGNDSLRKVVERVFRPELLEGVNPHRDNATDYPPHQWFGFVPLELYRQTENPQYLERGIEMAEEQFRDPDENGMPSYTSRMYVDDIYGATTMQSLAYACTGDEKYLERAVRQVLFYSKQFMQDEGLFYHNVEEAPHFWGRGNGWCAAAYAELFSVMPADHPKRDEVLSYYHRMMEALLKYQGPDGMWCQLVDDLDTWPESSCTGMFLFSMTEGIRLGILPSNQYTNPVVKGWQDLSEYIDAEWRIKEVCAGTSYGADREWYLNRPRLTGDPHGQAPLLWVTSSLLAALKE
jgi:unsaturated rhamnogalacturonyl hydrolase